MAAVECTLEHKHSVVEATYMCFFDKCLSFKQMRLFNYDLHFDLISIQSKVDKKFCHLVPVSKISYFLTWHISQRWDQVPDW